ncbi:MAG: hypothetical protein NUV91_06250, partial [Candidatus Omnitrophica bacterium]|nr:hypothetical protein [Candidatus Omnitrophota bacterium]
MNEAQALKDFVAKNVALLTAENLNRRDLKATVNDFYIIRHKKRFSIPTNIQIMESLVARLQTSMSEQQLHDLIDKLPLFRLTGETQIRLLHSLVSSKQIKSVLTDQQLSDLRQVGAFEAVERHIGNEIADGQRYKLENIEKQIQEKLEEYESLPSILDREVIPEPSFDPTVEDIKPWWERFYLRGNPFPRKDGLCDINISLYESVIIKTPPFQKTLSNLQRNSEHLFNSGFLLVGDYGYGKTTFIDYLSNYLISRDVLPLR